MGTKLTVEQVLVEITNQITRLENEVIQLRNENWQNDDEIQEIKDQLINSQGPSTMMGNESFMATLKVFFEKKESKVRVPEPHNWEGDWKEFDTFKRECETWLTGQKVTDQGKAVTLTMKGLATQWYTINQRLENSLKNLGSQWPIFGKRSKEGLGIQIPILPPEQN